MFWAATQSILPRRVSVYVHSWYWHSIYCTGHRTRLILFATDCLRCSWLFFIRFVFRIYTKLSFCLFPHRNSKAKTNSAAENRANTATTKKSNQKSNWNKWSKTDYAMFSVAINELMWNERCSCCECVIAVDCLCSFFQLFTTQIRWNRCHWNSSKFFEIDDNTIFSFTYCCYCWCCLPICWFCALLAVCRLLKYWVVNDIISIQHFCCLLYLHFWSNSNGNDLPFEWVFRRVCKMWTTMYDDVVVVHVGIAPHNSVHAKRLPFTAHIDGEHTVPCPFKKPKIFSI